MLEDIRIPNERRQYEYKSVFTYTDNTTDGNDKIMENLHRQIIIDGVDVSRCSDISGHVNDFGEYECLCRCIFGDGSDDYGVIGHEMCKDNPNCHYKNWKRKEQECEELRGDLYFTNEQLKDFKSHYDKVVEECENLREKYLGLKEQKGSYIVQLNTVDEQLDQLKAENEVLKGIRDRNFLHALEGQKRADKFSKTLTEIKEIAEVLITTTDEYDSCYYKDRCSKCEVKEDCQYLKIEQILQKIIEVQDGV